MKFADLDQKMRVYETAHDYCCVPGIWMVARLDGRSFTRLTKDIMDYEVPFDTRFRDTMVETTKYLVGEVGFRVVYGYTESDEISLLLHQDDTTFGRKLRKINSVLAGEASAKFSWMLGRPVCFDCRVSCLPNIQLVVDYFRWRQEDVHRNALNSHCYYALRKAGVTAKSATNKLSGTTVAEKNELLFQHKINFNDLPVWQKRGCGVYWETYEKTAQNPKTGKTVVAMRQRLQVNHELPLRDTYAAFIRNFVQATKETTT